MAEVALVYLMFSTILTLLQRRVEKRLSKYTMNNAAVQEALPGEAAR